MQSLCSRCDNGTQTVRARQTLAINCRNVCVLKDAEERVPVVGHECASSSDGRWLAPCWFVGGRHQFIWRRDASEWRAKSTSRFVWRTFWISSRPFVFSLSARFVALFDDKCLLIFLRALNFSLLRWGFASTSQQRKSVFVLMMALVFVFQTRTTFLFVQFFILYTCGFAQPICAVSSTLRRCCSYHKLGLSSVVHVIRRWC